MKLIDLEPRWWMEYPARDRDGVVETNACLAPHENGAAIVDHDPTAENAARADGRKLGVTFKCPLCRARTVAVPFANPIGGGEKTVHARTHWQREGETFASLTLSPSVNAEGCCNGPCRGWHGFIRNGEVT